MHDATQQKGGEEGGRKTNTGSNQFGDTREIEESENPYRRVNQMVD